MDDSETKDGNLTQYKRFKTKAEAEQYKREHARDFASTNTGYPYITRVDRDGYTSFRYRKAIQRYFKNLDDAIEFSKEQEK